MNVEIPGTSNKIRVKFEEFNKKVVKCTIYDDNICDDNIYNNSNSIVGISKCHPDDKFVFKDGAHLALQQALLKRSHIYSNIERVDMQKNRHISLIGGNLVYNNFIKKIFNKNN